MKIPPLPCKLTQEEVKLAAAIAGIVSALITLITVFTASRLVWQLFRFLKEARRTMPVVREAAEIYIDERRSPASCPEAGCPCTEEQE